MHRYHRLQIKRGHRAHSGRHVLSTCLVLLGQPWYPSSGITALSPGRTGNWAPAACSLQQRSLCGCASLLDLKASAWKGGEQTQVHPQCESTLTAKGHIQMQHRRLKGRGWKVEAEENQPKRGGKGWNLAEWKADYKEVQTALPFPLTPCHPSFPVTLSFPHSLSPPTVSVILSAPVTPCHSLSPPVILSFLVIPCRARAVSSLIPSPYSWSLSLFPQQIDHKVLSRYGIHKSLSQIYQNK